MRNDRGFSLIELVVVIALMAVLTGITGYSLRLISTTRAKSVAEKLKTAIDNTSQQAMACGGGSLEVYRDADGDLYVRQTIANGAQGGVPAIQNEKIGTSQISVTVQFSEGDSKAVTGSGDNGLKLEFNPGSGSFKGTTPKYIIVSASGRVYKLRCYALTGKVTIE